MLWGSFYLNNRATLLIPDSINKNAPYRHDRSPHESGLERCYQRDTSEINYLYVLHQYLIGDEEPIVCAAKTLANVDGLLEDVLDHPTLQNSCNQDDILKPYG